MSSAVVLYDFPNILRLGYTVMLYDLDAQDLNGLIGIVYALEFENEKVIVKIEDRLIKLNFNNVKFQSGNGFDGIQFVVQTPENSEFKRNFFACGQVDGGDYDGCPAIFVSLEPDMFENYKPQMLLRFTECSIADHKDASIYLENIEYVLKKASVDVHADASNESGHLSFTTDGAIGGEEVATGVDFTLPR